MMEFFEVFFNVFFGLIGICFVVALFLLPIVLILLFSGWWGFLYFAIIPLIASIVESMETF